MLVVDAGCDNVMLRGLRERFRFLTSSLTPQQLRWLGVVALEQPVGVTLLEHVEPVAPPRVRGGSRSATAGAAVGAFLEAGVGSGLLRQVGTVRSLDIVRTGPVESAYVVDGEFRALVLKQLAARGELIGLGRACADALAKRSFASIAVMLVMGDVAVLPRLDGLVQGANEPERLRFEQLVRELLCEPFDSDWLEQSFRGRARTAALSGLRLALLRMWPCEGLYRWALESRNEVEGVETEVGEPLGRQARAGVICEHALFRHQPDVLQAWMNHLPLATRTSYAAALSFQGGDLEGAQQTALQLLEAGADVAPMAGGTRRRVTLVSSEAGMVTPLVGLLWLREGGEERREAAKRLLSARIPDGPLALAARAFRTLVKYIEQPAIEHVRIDVHQLSPSVSAWEALLLGLTVHLHLQQEYTRASWAKYLVERAGQWLDAGYVWMARQGLWLAQALHLEYSEQGLSELAQRWGTEAPNRTAGELALSDLLAAKPDWEKLLEAIDQAIDEPQLQPERRYRVKWFVDMVNGTLSRPALQECSSGASWSRGLRTTPAQLWELREELPAEDAAVISYTVGRDQEREFRIEAMEALIGHPRVYDGARPGRRIDVVRGAVRMETQDHADALEIRIRPPLVQAGVYAIGEGDSRLAVYRVSPQQQRLAELLPDGVRVPHSHQHRALEVLAKWSPAVEIKSPHLTSDGHVPADATPCLQIAPHAGAWLVQSVVRPFGAGGRWFVAATGPREALVYVDGQLRRSVRDFEAELARIEELRHACPLLTEDVVAQSELAARESAYTWTFSEEGLLELLSQLHRAETPHALEWPRSNPMRVRGSVGLSQLRGSLKRRKGWYLLTGGLQIDDSTTVDFTQLLTLPLVARGRFVRLPNGDLVELERKVRRVMAALAVAQPARGEGSALRVPEADLFALRSLSETGASIEWDESARQWMERVERALVEGYEVPETLNATLRAYQVEGYRWLSSLCQLGFGACLADEMGLGKTVQVLAVLLARVELGPALVVAPTSVCSNWQAEARRFAPELDVVEYLGPERERSLAEIGQRRAQLVITSYNLLQQDAEALCAISWATVVLDEAQFIKNPQSLRAKASFRLSSGFRIAATGTPVENHLGDLWSIFHFLNPSLLGSWRSFQQRFVKPIEREQDAERRAQVRELVQPFILRRTKSEVLRELPPMTVVKHEVRLSESEAQLYALLRRQIGERLTMGSVKRENKLEILAEISRLRRFCCHPRLVFPDAGHESSKIDAFMDLVDELCANEHRALVFSQYVDFLALVRERLEERGIGYRYLDGSTPQAKRPLEVQAFQEGSAPLFLISLKAGGFGLNLTAADYVVHLDPWWNPAVEAQAADRAHRIGQTRPVTVYRLVTKETIEEQIVELHGSKRRLAESVLEGGAEIGRLSVGELVGLIETRTGV